jgi:hypothetical protein
VLTALQHRFDLPQTAPRHARPVGRSRPRSSSSTDAARQEAPSGRAPSGPPTGPGRERSSGPRKQISVELLP